MELADTSQWDMALEQGPGWGGRGWVASWGERQSREISLRGAWSPLPFYSFLLLDFIHLTSTGGEDRNASSSELNKTGCGVEQLPLLLKDCNSLDGGV